jgi:excisionase family DNA binding protein
MTTDMVQSLATKLVEEITAQVLAKTQAPTRGLESRLMTVKEAAHYLARSEQAIRHLVFQRDLPVVRSGRNVRLDRKDLDRWIENSRT